MYFEFLTREIFDTLIIGVVIIGSALAFLRLRADFTRPLPDYRPAWSDEDTAEHPTQQSEPTVREHDN